MIALLQGGWGGRVQDGPQRHQAVRGETGELTVILTVRCYVDS